MPLRIAHAQQVLRKLAAPMAAGGVRAAAAQRRYLSNPTIEEHQEGEMLCFPPRPQPKVLYTGPHKFEAAYILQREPVITPEKHPLLRDFEAAVDKESAQYPRTADGSNLSSAFKKRMPDAYKAVQGSSATPYWREPKYVQAELNVLRSFQIQQRVTQHDIKDETSRKTLNRRLQERLFLIVEKDGVWQFPSTPRKQGESMRATLDRALEADHKGAIDTYSISNAPATHVKMENGPTVCFYQVYYLMGMPAFPIGGSTSHAWVTRNELREYKFPSLEYKQAAYLACYDEWMPYNVPIYEN